MLNILQEFEGTEDWVLEAGDMLYIPPGVAHWGTAEGDDCITYSIGFRAPSVADIFTELSQDIASHLSNDQRYRDPALAPAENPGEIPADTLNALDALIQRHLTPEAIQHWFGRYMTVPKYPDLEPDTPEETGQDWTTFSQLERHPASRFAFYPEENEEATLYVDGEQYLCSRALAECLCATISLDTHELRACAQSEQDQALISELVEAGKLWG